MQILRRHTALVALVAAGLLWGLTVPCRSSSSSGSTAAGSPSCASRSPRRCWRSLARKHLRAAFTPRILAAGAIGYGVVIVLQNAGIEHTSVSHASLIVGATPALVALIAAATGRGSSGRSRGSASRSRSRAWGSSPAAAGGGASLGGDALVLLSVAVSAHVRRRPAVAAARARPVRGDRGADDRRRARRAARTRRSRASRTRPRRRRPWSRCSRWPSSARVGPFALFAYGQSRVAPELAGAFLNLEPLVGTAAGALRLRRPVRPDAAARRRRDPRGHRAQHDAAQALRDARGGPRHAARSTDPSGAALPHLQDARQPPSREPARVGNYVSSSTPPPSLSNMTLLAPPTRPHPDSPHLCGPGGPRAPLLLQSLPAAGLSSSSAW